MGTIFVDQFLEPIKAARSQYAFGIGTRKRPCRTAFFADGNLYLRFRLDARWRRVDTLEGSFVRIDEEQRECDSEDRISVAV